MSNRKLTKKAVIDYISPIHGADYIELAHVGGWQVVIKKGDFHAGDTAFFFELGAALPINDERFSFLKNCKRSWEDTRDRPMDSNYHHLDFGV